ncbi:hypothetical protein [Acuticoccus sp.]|uniref:hypothetical protein n=1 Tax=Acuticoccus sp. TaxID=1904378 RepID=UPI003B526816
MSRLTVLAGLLALCACSPNVALFDTERVYVEVPIYIKGPATDAQKNAIVDHVRNEFKDPYSIRDAEVSHYGMQAEGSTRERTVVCVQLNAKNGFGSYTGRRIWQFDLGPSSVREASTEHPQCTEMNGKGLRYEPFPELEALALL